MDICLDGDWKKWTKSQCKVDCFNVIVGLLSLYVVTFTTGYLKWGESKRKEESTGKAFPLHDFRGFLYILTILVHFLELSDVFLTYPPSHVLAVCTASFAFWTASLILSHNIEKAVRPIFLILTATLWLLNGIARVLRLIVLIETGLSFKFLRPLAALLCFILYFSISAAEICAYCRQKLITPTLDIPLTTTSRYKHDNAHFISKATFHWLTPLLRTGYKCPLEMDDLGVLPENHRGRTQLQLFDQYYYSSKGSHLSKFWKSCWKFMETDFMLGGVWKLAGDLLSLVGPLGISIIVNFVGKQKFSPNGGKVPAYPTINDFWENGWTMSVVVLIASIAQSTCSQTTTHLVNVKAIHLNAALQAKIYAKSLLVSKIKDDADSKSVDKDDPGSVSHLLSEDTVNIMSAFWISHYIWAIPLKISLLLYLLYANLGTSALLGSLLTILTLTPLQLYIGRAMSKNSAALSDITDERLQQVSSLISNAKLLKMLGWEALFADKIHATRRKEELRLNDDSIYWAAMTFLTHIASILAAVITLTTHQWINGSSLAADKVFTVLALFNQLTVPLFIFPVTIPIFIAALVSGRRLSDYFSQPEIEKTLPKVERSIKLPKFSQPEEFSCEGSLADFDMLWTSEIPDNVFTPEETQGIEEDIDDKAEEATAEVEDNEEEIAVEVVAAQFTWGNDSRGQELTIENFVIPRGKITMIVGKVGSGKTSMLSALLGEMKKTSGEVKWRRNTVVAYAGQSPWLLNGTVRDNITFGRPYRPGRYAQVLAACGLQPDLDILPDKDQTEIGEKGIQLSGGQKQRIGVARALYSRANFVILDDPLSSLDHTLALHVFEAGIKRLVRRSKRTVLLVVHHLSLLPQAHKIIVMEGGKIRMQGNVKDLESLDQSIVASWKEAVGNVEDDDKGRTARERWQLVKVVASIGLELRQRMLDPAWQSEDDINEMTLTRQSTRRRRNPPLSEWSFLSHDLPLPTEECGVVRPPWRPYPSNKRQLMSRANSLQTRQIRMTPVSRQHSSPLMLGGRQRSRSNPSSRSLIRNLFKDGAPPVPVKPRTHQPIQRLSSTESGFSDSNSEVDPDEYEEGDVSTGGVANEERMYGRIPKEICKLYMKSCGKWLTIVYIIITLAWQVTRVLTDAWLTKWTDSSSTQDTSYFLAVYGILSAAAVAFSLCSHGVGQWASAKARILLHKDLVNHVAKCQVSVFETTPAGRFINRFSTDISVIDKKLGTSIQRLVQFILLCGSALLVNTAVTPWFLVIAIPICCFYFVIQIFYRTSSRELQRLDSISRSPVLSHLLQTQSGLSTIRAYSLEDKFTAMFLAKLDQHTNAFLILNTTNRWLGIILDYLGGLIVFLAIWTALFSSSVASPSLIGLAINYTLLVPIYLNWVVKFLAECEMYMGAVERVTQCFRLPVEEDSKIAGKPEEIPKNWPSRGEINFEKVALRYGTTREPVFMSLDLYIPPGQMLGICGRSGSGKSTLILSLFRLLETTAGHIFIDSIDITKVPLSVLRGIVAIIPQEASLIAGTVRGNLDPQQRCTDDQLWSALQKVRLKNVVEHLFDGLDGEIHEGASLSSGQRQLFCLARAVLQEAAILVMDEATSSLDWEAEHLLMKTAKEAFKGKTIIIIAHRLTTLTDCERIIVIDRGRIAEDGTPNQLLNKQMGLFSTMLRRTEHVGL